MAQRWTEYVQCPEHVGTDSQHGNERAYGRSRQLGFSAPVRSRRTASQSGLGTLGQPARPRLPLWTLLMRKLARNFDEQCPGCKFVSGGRERCQLREGHSDKHVWPSARRVRTKGTIK